MTPRVAARLALAAETLAAARYNLDGDFRRTAVNRAYYAAFYAAEAALHAVGEAPKTHAGVLQRFLVQFVQTGRLTNEQVRALPRAYQLRQDADYDDGAWIDREMTAAIIEDVARFVQAVTDLLEDKKGP